MQSWSRQFESALVPPPIGELDLPKFESEIRRQLERILGNPIFLNSPQASHLLTFIVTETLSGQTATARETLKEYSLAVNVFGRPSSFDPSTDNIVRVEVRRVRSKLDRYYADPGASDPIWIHIPKGAYLPHFHRRDSSQIDLSGRTISHYDLIRRSCVNQWQSTYEARCRIMHRPVVVIVPSRSVLEDDERQERLLTETSLSASIQDPAVAKVEDVERNADQLLVAMAPLPGRSLRDRVDSELLSPEETFRFGVTLANSLGKGHSVGLLHGNLVPDSISVEEGPSGTLTPHIFSFGISSLVDFTNPDFEGFSPPELQKGEEADLRSDVWSFGAIVWFVCHGEPPPPRLSEEWQVPRSSMMPAPLNDVVRRCLSPDPATRFSNALEIVSVLAAPPSAAPDLLKPHPAAIPRVGSRNNVWVLTALVTLLIAAVAFAAKWRSNTPLPSDARVVVLPFVSAGRGPDTGADVGVLTAFFGARMASLPMAYVISPRTIDRYSMDFLRDQVRADYALDGALLKSEFGFDVSVSLIRVVDGSYAWSGTSAGAWSSFSAKMEELAKMVETALGIAIQKDRSRRPPIQIPPREFK